VPTDSTQELTAALRMLAAQGVEAFAAEHCVPPLSADERAALESEEARVAGGVGEREA
jgi:hypothetical protein